MRSPMNYKLCKKVEPYHPEGDTEREKTDEFVFWIFKLKYQAEAAAKVYRERYPDEEISVVETEEEAW